MNTPACLQSRHHLLTTAAMAGGLALLPRSVRAAGTPRPPVARIEPVAETLWGERIVDPYRWLENTADRDWMPLMRGQDAHVRRVLEANPDRTRLLKRIAEVSGDVTQVVYPKPAGLIRFLQKREASW